MALIKECVAWLLALEKGRFLSGSIPSRHKGSLKADVTIINPLKKKKRKDKYSSKN